ncbi:MAG: hypothetical protein QOE39_211 [Bradyrhizobium sp.]|nr:hypothetical protein [Bradyrhizobium sp.]
MPSTKSQTTVERRLKQVGKAGGVAPQRLMTTRSGGSLYRVALLAGASVAALLATNLGAEARSLGNSSASAVTNVTAQQIAAAQQAQAAAANAQSALVRTTRALQAMQATQAAARNAALQASSSIPNGLATGGLRVAPGVATNPDLWQGANLPTQTQAGGRTQVEVKQNQQKAILTWDTFNVGRDTTLYFNQSAGKAADGSNSWMALNRVLDPAAAPSKILGSIKAEGQVYIVNQNGIVFGGASQVNVGTLVASTLNITDAIFKGTLADSTWSSSEVPVFAAPASGFVGDVSVERGARIVAQGGGHVLLLGQNAINSGEIQADDGQVALVAGRSVVMRASDVTKLRGFEFEINDASGGTATNGGLIATARGNITLAGRNVAQNGLALATTSVSANGSITLHARDEFFYNYVDSVLGYSRTGTVILGEGSVTSILPQLDDASTIAATKLTDRSTIDIVGGAIQFQRNALAQATGGDVTVKAASSSQTVGSVADATSRIYLEEGAWIDVSGSVGVEVAVASNIIPVELRANELADSPLQRNSFLYGRTIYVDMRRSGYFTDDLMKSVEWYDGEPGKWYGTPLANVSGYISLVRRGIGELTTAGGTITLQSQGDLVTKDGSLLTASGGSIHYAPGYVNTTRLIDANGRLVNIGDADPSQRYIGIAGQFVRDHSRWGITETWSSPLLSGQRYDAGYTQGAAGGIITLSAPRDQLNGSVYAEAGVSDRERENATTGGTLSLGNDLADANSAVRVGDVLLTAAASSATTSADFNSGPLTESTLVLSTDTLTDGGFGSLAIYSSGTINVAADAHLALLEGGAVTLAGTNVKVDGAITVHGGAIRLSSLSPAASRGSLDPTLPRNITIGATAVLDVSGLWINDLLDRTAGAPLVIDGGSIELLTPGYAPYNTTTQNVDLGVVTLEKGSLLNANGGGQANAKGTLKAGDGGSITLRGKDLHLDGTFTSDALGDGGTLSLTARKIQVSGTAAPDTLMIDPSLFTHGFGKYVLNGYDSLVVTPGTVVTAARPTLMLFNYTALPSGSSLTYEARWMPEGQRQAVDLSFSSARPVYTVDSHGPSQTDVSGDLDIGVGALLHVDAGGSVALQAGRFINVGGTIEAHGGAIDISLGGSSSVSVVLRPRRGAPEQRDRPMAADRRFGCSGDR